MVIHLLPSLIKTRASSVKTCLATCSWHSKRLRAATYRVAFDFSLASLHEIRHKDHQSRLATDQFCKTDELMLLSSICDKQTRLQGQTWSLAQLETAKVVKLQVLVFRLFHSVLLSRSAFLLPLTKVNKKQNSLEKYLNRCVVALHQVFFFSDSELRVCSHKKVSFLLIVALF